MSIKFRVDIDLSQFDKELSIERVGDALRGAMTEATNMIHDQWVEKIKRVPSVWHVERTAYIQSLQQRVDMSGPLMTGEVWTDYKLAEDIERGRPERDLKKMLDTSPNVRRTEAGKRFLIIPMRHNTPGHGALANDMPKPVYLVAKSLPASSVASNVMRPAGQVMRMGPGGMRPSPNQSPFLSNQTTKGKYLVAGNTYNWGGRIPSNPALGQGFAKLKPEHSASIYSGMVKMNTSSQKAKSSEYMTFRVMTSDQDGKWIIPAQPPRYLALSTADELRPSIEALFQRALQL